MLVQLLRDRSYMRGELVPTNLFSTSHILSTHNSPTPLSSQQIAWDVTDLLTNLDTKSSGYHLHEYHLFLGTVSALSSLYYGSHIY